MCKKSCEVRITIALTREFGLETEGIYSNLQVFEGSLQKNAIFSAFEEHPYLLLLLCLSLFFLAQTGLILYRIIMTTVPALMEVKQKQKNFVLFFDNLYGKFYAF
jgi:hypothetical protein